MSNFTRYILEDIGLRYDTPSYQDVYTDKGRTDLIYAHCSWWECVGRSEKKVIYKPTAKPGSRRCPDCGHALSWKASRSLKDQGGENS